MTETSDRCVSGTQMLLFWTKGQPGFRLPSGLGVRVGGDSGISFLVLSVHYYATDGATTASGVSMATDSRTQGMRSAAVLQMKNCGTLPPHAATSVEGACEVREDVVMHAFAFQIHAHALTSRVSGWRIDRRSGVWDLLGVQSASTSHVYHDMEHEVAIRPGDFVAARCLMNNTNDYAVFVGSVQRRGIACPKLFEQKHNELRDVSLLRLVLRGRRPARAAERRMPVAGSSVLLLVYRFVAASRGSAALGRIRSLAVDPRTSSVLWSGVCQTNSPTTEMFSERDIQSASRILLPSSTTQCFTL